LKADPVIKFVVDELDSKDSVEITYWVEKRVFESDVKDWSAPIVVGFEEANCIEACHKKPCQTGVCDEGTGECNYTNQSDQKPCGENMHCYQGTCISSESKKQEVGQLDTNSPKILILLTTLAAVVTFSLIILAVQVKYKKQILAASKRIFGKKP